LFSCFVLGFDKCSAFPPLRWVAADASAARRIASVEADVVP
jgi:hypothetical protein